MGAPSRPCSPRPCLRQPQTLNQALASSSPEISREGAGVRGPWGGMEPC